MSGATLTNSDWRQCDLTEHVSLKSGECYFILMTIISIHIVNVLQIWITCT